MSQANLDLELDSLSPDLMKASNTNNPILENEDEIPDENGQSEDQGMIEPFDPTQIKIEVKQDTLRNLIDRLSEDAIDMNTDFQRHADLWSVTNMSKLIESILIRFPLPAFYFDASNEDRWLIVDGLQRLSSIRKFVLESDANKQLRLQGLEYLDDFEGKTFWDLPRTFQRRIYECPVTMFLIQQGTPDQVKYSIFRRINTGGLVLNNQEIRNAMAQTRERQFLERLAQDENLVKTMGNQSKRMLDQELVLRFLAFYTQDYLKSKKNIAEFLDEEMDALKKRTDAQLHDLERGFRRAVRLGYEVFGDSAFEKITEDDPQHHKRKNTTLFEVWTVCLARINDEEAMIVVNQKEQIIQRLMQLHANDNDFYRSISLATQKREHVRIRYNRVESILREVINA